MKKVNLLFLFVLTFNVYGTDLTNCQAYILAAHKSECVTTIFRKGDSAPTTTSHPGCDAGKAEALNNCSLGFIKSYLVQLDATNTFGPSRFVTTTIKRSDVAGSLDYKYISAYRLSTNSTLGKGFSKKCYINNLNADFFGFHTKDANCAGNPTTNFTLTENRFCGRHIPCSITHYFNPHLMGYSYTDTASTVPLYSCSHTYVVPGPITKTAYFTDTAANCHGKTVLGTLGFVLPVTP